MTPIPNRPLDEPLVFAPYFRPQIWGGRRLETLLYKPLPPDVAVGESWELSVQPLHVSRVAEGPFTGVSLQQLWDERRSELLGRDMPLPLFPWLVKWLDCQELLSVQVHPDDATAQRLLGEPFGKTESWVVLHAEPTARIYAGFKEGVTRAAVERQMESGAVAECLHSFTPHPGDCLHIPAGTVHAVGGGVLLAEVQQTSDATFRMFDWNRVDAHGNPRTLHLAQAFEAIDFRRGPVNPIPPIRLADRELLVDSPYYRLERIAVTEPAVFPGGELFAVMAVQGAAVLSAPNGLDRTVRAGETVLVPAAVPECRWAPSGTQTVLLRIGLPGSGGPLPGRPEPDRQKTGERRTG